MKGVHILLAPVQIVPQRVLQNISSCQVYDTVLSVHFKFTMSHLTSSNGTAHKSMIGNIRLLPNSAAQKISRCIREVKVKMVSRSLLHTKNDDPDLSLDKENA